jgi:hypothetical protein
LLLDGLEVGAGGPLVDHHPRASMLVPVALQTGALLSLSTFAGLPALAVALVALSGFAFAALTTALGSRVLEVAPGSTDLAAVAVLAGSLVAGIAAYLSLRFLTRVGGAARVPARRPAASAGCAARDWRR